MSTATVLNLAMANGVEPGPFVIPYERAHMVPREQLIAVWCEAVVGFDGETLAQRIAASRSTARDLKRPVAIWTGERAFDHSVLGLTAYGDQFWMNCTFKPDESIDQMRAAYHEALDFCPLARTVLVVGLDWPAELAATSAIAHLRLCAELLQERDDVVGVVSIGVPLLDDVEEIIAVLREVSRLPPIEDVDLWSGEAQESS